ncbi:MAG: hypothetical protein LBF85_03655 [Tannerella sp.]|nr:hypothetical protein [Tannerella sp.]
MEKIFTGLMALLLAGWISCGKEPSVATLPPEEPEAINPVGEEPYAVAVIENLQTRLRILEPKFDVKRNEIWRSSPRDVIINYPPSPQYEADTYFGYADADGRIVHCEVINLPGSAKQWNGEFFQTGWTAVTEISVQMNGTVRLYTGDEGETYGTLELTSLEPVPESSLPVNLQPGVYRETYPSDPDNVSWTEINLIDKENLEIATFLRRESPQADKYKYEIREHAIILASVDGGHTYYPDELFFHVVNDSVFEVQYLHAHTAGQVGFPVMTFEKETP